MLLGRVEDVQSRSVSGISPSLDIELDPRDYAAEFEHAKANLTTRTAEAYSAQVTVPIVDASVIGQLHSARSSTPSPGLG